MNVNENHCKSMVIHIHLWILEASNHQILKSSNRPRPRALLRGQQYLRHTPANLGSSKDHILKSLSLRSARGLGLFLGDSSTYVTPLPPPEINENH